MDGGYLYSRNNFVLGSSAMRYECVEYASVKHESVEREDDAE